MTTAPARKAESTAKTDLVEMSWDPITRIVGSLGIYTKIDWAAKKVVECHSTSSVFRGYSIFMKGKDPRDAHFITSRICGICGDNHATCSVYNQNMAYGVRPPHLGEWIINLGEAAEYMFDHNIFQENLVGVDYCERMVKETNPGVLERANSTEAPHAADHAGTRPARGDGVGPDHPDRRQPRHLHQDRLCQQACRRVLQHVVGVPRLQHLHE
ncbi:MAG TPA: nickel-dependent hydrogenase large subunit, partial [Amycolatopsis sp.]|nr:nickel-dependent hydrogenase large subunit [Amycolatopsis sp.]